jgi:hypothetical protein
MKKQLPHASHHNQDTPPQPSHQGPTLRPRTTDLRRRLTPGVACAVQHRSTLAARGPASAGSTAPSTPDPTVALARGDVGS